MAIDDTAVSGDPMKLMPRLKQIHKLSEFPTGMGPEDWDAMKQSPGKVKKAAGILSGLFGPPSMSEQYYMRSMGPTGDEESMPIELVSMAGPEAAQGAHMAHMAKQLAERPNQRLAERYAMRRADNDRITRGLALDLMKQGSANMEKEAATRQVKILRRLFEEGKINEATRLAKQLSDAGVLKSSGPGTNIGRLGVGAEAVADLVVGARAAPGKVVVRKAFDTKGPLFSKELLGEKVQAYRAVRAAGNEDKMAKLYGKLGKGEKGGRYLHTEYVPNPRPYTDLDDTLPDLVRVGRAQAAAKRTGKEFTEEGFEAARAAKRKKIENYLESKRNPLAKYDAEDAIPQRGGAILDDLHHENVANVGNMYNQSPKILDFVPIQARRQWRSRVAAHRLLNEIGPEVPIDRQKRSLAKVFGEKWGKRPSASDIDVHPAHDIWGNSLGWDMAAGIKGGPRSGAEAVKRSLVGLGKGSKQTKKVRGTKQEAQRLTREGYGDPGRLREAGTPKPLKSYASHKPINWGEIAAVSTLPVLGLAGAGRYIHGKIKDRKEAKEEMKKAAEAQIKTKLLPHQERVVRKMKDRPGLVVAHGLGSGKTLSSIAAAVRLRPGRTQVLVPASLQANYKKELEKHVEGVPPIEVGSLQGAVTKGDVPDADLLVVDEAHRGRNPVSKTYHMIHDAKSKKRLLLTASPTYNSPADVAALVNMAAGDKVLPMGASFEKEYIAKPHKGLLGLLPFTRKQPELKNKEQLKKTLRQWVDYHASGGEGFPDVEEERYAVKMTKRQTKLHDAAWDKLSLVSKLRLRRGLPPDKKDLSKINNFQSQTRQISSSEARYTKDGAAESSPKIQKAVGLLDTEVKSNPNHRALVYSNYLNTLRDYSRELSKKSIPHAIFSGEKKMKDRKQMVEDYNSGKLKALLVSSAGGEGLDLKGTRQVQVLEPHWNVEKLKQVEGRAIRRGSHAHLPKSQQKVMLQRFESYPRGGIFKKRRGVEQVLGDMAANKEMLNQQLVGLLKEV